MSVQLAAHCLNHGLPPLDKAPRHQARMSPRDFLDLGHLLQHQRQVSDRPLTSPRHVGKAGQGLSAEKDAAVGFGGRHWQKVIEEGAQW